MLNWLVQIQEHVYNIKYSVLMYTDKHGVNHYIDTHWAQGDPLLEDLGLWLVRNFQSSNLIGWHWKVIKIYFVLCFTLILRFNINVLLHFCFHLKGNNHLLIWHDNDTSDLLFLLLLVVLCMTEIDLFVDYHEMSCLSTLYSFVQTYSFCLRRKIKQISLLNEISDQSILLSEAKLRSSICHWKGLGDWKGSLSIVEMERVPTANERVSDCDFCPEYFLLTGGTCQPQGVKEHEVKWIFFMLQKWNKRTIPLHEYGL